MNSYVADLLQDAPATHARPVDAAPVLQPVLAHQRDLPVSQAALVVHVVDDDEAVRRSLAVLLSSFGVLTETHDSAQTLLARLDVLRPGCLIIDIRMPGMDGLELQAELNRRHCGLPVVIVSGHGDVGLAVRAMKAGALDFIEKPYSDEDLIAGPCPRSWCRSCG